MWVILIEVTFFVIIPGRGHHVKMTAGQGAVIFLPPPIIYPLATNEIVIHSRPAVVPFAVVQHDEGYIILVQTFKPVLAGALGTARVNIGYKMNTPLHQAETVPLIPRNGAVVGYRVTIEVQVLLLRVNEINEVLIQSGKV